MMKKGLVVLVTLITGVERNVSFSLMNALSCSFPHWKVIPFWVKLWSSYVRAEKLGINFGKSCRTQ